MLLNVVLAKPVGKQGIFYFDWMYFIMSWNMVTVNLGSENPFVKLSNVAE